MAENAEAEESGISMVEVLQEEEERQLNAAAVLGAADDTRCTYDQGYMKRQALYACMTCCPADGDHQAGVCLACSYHCHEDHDLVELYTKRNFRCDCGNSKFPHNPCKLLKEKLPENSENKYNHNFRGVYCTCNRPYPDPEDPNEDEMIQCCLCEDWYHGKHQGGSVPPAEVYGDMICTQCLPKHEFLAYFVGLAVTVVEEEETKGKVGNENSPSKNTQEEESKTKVGSEKSPSKNTQEGKAKTTVDTEESSIKTTQDEVKNEEKKVCYQSENMTESECKENMKETGAEKSQKSECKLISMTKHALPKGALFLPNSWRQQLCVCDSCKATYKDEGIIFLLDDEDTVNFYEESGKSYQPSSSAPVQRELEALSSLDRVVRTEMVHEYNNLSSSLREYLRKFAESKKVVRDEDIREFFSQLAANKKQKPNSGVQLFCR
ncbi:hypothetical protein O3P69_008465 [Scylla paramamosain]|uniref:UBR-type domain-containing protein n=1 Tax=Scylla paramamosain TaxID=85552 RepID=A0AAW0SK05_SCYPA